MAENDPFKNQQKLRKAKIVTPPNEIKEKIGSGGIDEALLNKAEEELENNQIDFRPIAAGLLKELDQAVQDAEVSILQDEADVEALLYPSAQLKAQGSMFRYPLVSDISDILVNFLETVTVPISHDALEIVTAHKMAISVVISTNMTDKNHPQGAELKRSLTEACGRYYKARKA